ncbi:MAG: hypothetical protein JJ843_00835 [Prochlorococcus marinus CUG1434]|nr:hypothetical protein [Prochlorococcus marinus CUG1434]
MNSNKIDLLRKRRDANNLASPYFTETNKYIKKGIFSGIIIIIISLVLGIPFIFRIKYLESKKTKIKVFSDQYDVLEKKLEDEKKQLNQISSFNNKISDSILNISSSSALFQEIALIIPKDIQLLEFTSKGNSLILKASLSNNKYLEILNSFLIKLDESELVKFNDMDLKNIRSFNQQSQEKDYLFNINTKISTKYADINKKYLIKLGSYGLFNRLNILENIDKNID